MKKEQPKLVDPKAKDIDITPRRNLSAYIASSHLTTLGTTNIVNYKLSNLYNS